MALDPHRHPLIGDHSIRRNHQNNLQYEWITQETYAITHNQKYLTDTKIFTVSLMGVVGSSEVTPVPPQATFLSDNSFILSMMVILILLLTICFIRLQAINRQEMTWQESHSSGLKVTWISKQHLKAQLHPKQPKSHLQS